MCDSMQNWRVPWINSVFKISGTCLFVSRLINLTFLKIMGFTGSPPGYLAPSGLGGSVRGSAGCGESAIIVMRFVCRLLLPAISMHPNHQR